jgi:SAM-dependent methyltransferase
VGSGGNDNSPQSLSPSDLREISAATVGHYDAAGNEFWEGTRGHDVSQNTEALLEAVSGALPYRILDLGCGPGRDLMYFAGLGHQVIGLDGSSVFVEMARKNSGCEVLHQDFLALDLPAASFHGVFANASLFHVPCQELPRVLAELHDTLRDGGVLFSSNPRGDDREGWSGQRYGSYRGVETWRRYGAEAGFTEVRQYFRPAGRPREQQPWSATVWRKGTC